MLKFNKIVTMIIIFCILLATIVVADEQKYTNANEVLKLIPVYKDSKADGILIKVYVNKKGIVYGYEIGGHSGYAQKGEDIVCAGVSTLAQNTPLSIKLFTKDKIELNVKDDYVKCIVPDLKDNKGSSESNVLLNSAVLGFYSIQLSYGTEYVSVFKVVN